MKVTTRAIPAQWHRKQFESGGVQNAGAKHRPKNFDVPLQARGTTENTVGTAERQRKPATALGLACM